MCNLSPLFTIGAVISDQTLRQMCGADGPGLWSGITSVTRHRSCREGEDGRRPADRNEQERDAGNISPLVVFPTGTTYRDLGIRGRLGHVQHGLIIIE